MQDSGLTEIIPFIWLSAIWGQSYMGVVDGSFLGSGIHIWRARTPDGCDILVYWYSKKYSISHTLYQFSFQSQRKAMSKNAQTTAQLLSSHMLVK